MFTDTPGRIIGYRKNGMPIRLQAGGSHPLPPASEVVPEGTPAVPQNTPVPQQPVPPVPQQYFTAEQVAAARQQEKDKLYGRLEESQKRVADIETKFTQWEAERKAEQDKLKAEQEKAAEERRKAEEDKLSVKELLDKREAEFKQQQAEMQKQWDTERAIAAKDRQLFALKSFIQRRVAEEVAQDTIAPEFLDYIDGESEAEVEASITKAKEKTASIVAGIGGQPGSQPRTPGVSPAGFSPSGPLDNITGARTYTEEQINAMSMKEYEAFRAQRGIDKAGNNHGMFN